MGRQAGVYQPRVTQHRMEKYSIGPTSMVPRHAVEQPSNSDHGLTIWSMVQLGQLPHFDAGGMPLPRVGDFPDFALTSLTKQG